MYARKPIPASFRKSLQPCCPKTEPPVPVIAAEKYSTNAIPFAAALLFLFLNKKKGDE
ncbi:MAG: hypothetical protein IKU21_06735 [Anaerotignum sp.]|nr:hypothetical protein [Anaerotignum sp.]